MATNDTWQWIEPSVIQAVHDAQLAEHGGAGGTRDEGMLESALTRPRNAAAYGNPDVSDLAAEYAFGLARNHPFIDGNKRTAFVACELFLRLNGHQLMASDADCVLTMLAVASGDMDVPAFAAWLRQHLQPRP